MRTHFPRHLHKLCVVCGIVSGGFFGFFFPPQALFIYFSVLENQFHIVPRSAALADAAAAVGRDDTVHHFSRR